MSLKTNSTLCVLLWRQSTIWGVHEGTTGAYWWWFGKNTLDLWLGLVQSSRCYLMLSGTPWGICWAEVDTVNAKSHGTGWSHPRECRPYCRDQGFTGRLTTGCKPWGIQKVKDCFSPAQGLYRKEFLAFVGATKDAVVSSKSTPSGQWVTAGFSSTSKGNISNLWLHLSSPSQWLCSWEAITEGLCRWAPI